MCLYSVLFIVLYVSLFVHLVTHEELEDLKGLTAGRKEIESGSAKKESCPRVHMAHQSEKLQSHKKRTRLDKQHTIYVPNWLVGLPDECAVLSTLKQLERNCKLVEGVAQHPILQENGYWLEKSLGVGTYGAVFKAQYLRPRLGLQLSSDVQFADAAVKVISKTLIPSEVLDSVRNKETFIQLSVGTHANIVTLFMALETDGFFLMPMEFCGEGDVFRTVKKEKSIGERRAVRYAIHLFRGITFLHSRGTTSDLSLPCNVSNVNSIQLRNCVFSFPLYRSRTFGREAREPAARQWASRESERTRVRSARRAEAGGLRLRAPLPLASAGRYSSAQ